MFPVRYIRAIIKKIHEMLVIMTYGITASEIGYLTSVVRQIL